MGVWRVKAYVEYEIDANTKEQSIERLTECLIHDLQEYGDIREVAEVGTEKISDGKITDA